jgi:hypothetical protein
MPAVMSHIDASELKEAHLLRNSIVVCLPGRIVVWIACVAACPAGA